ncbi:hypothetical protein PoB_005914600 [Plakobranchus ocellatus]|uniref:Uncharacterized protein n=1 Tax=Plakobranchus ocellatus TaxID=259542 RepID=A0AAV4CLN4_9GAST|nr:hypothetical protein PoB_005914600 [Plakobranchus ocellatus]
MVELSNPSPQHLTSINPSWTEMLNPGQAWARIDLVKTMTIMERCDAKTETGQGERQRGQHQCPEFGRQQRHAISKGT